MSEVSCAYLFPGQGSQHVGMGCDLHAAFSTARAVFDLADRTLGIPLSRLCFCGPPERLNDTLNAQPSILAASIAALRVLQERGYEVVEAYDGQDGLEKARQERPDLIILDAMISKMNDYEVLRTLKYETETRDACVIVLAAATSPEEVAEILNRGADRCGEPDTLPDLLVDPP